MLGAILRRIVLSLICVLVAASCLHSTQHKTENKTSKEKPVLEISLVAKRLLESAIPAGVTEEDMVAWGKVNICEMDGNWTYQGPIYSGGLGIKNTNWVAFGGIQYAPNAGLANPQQQIAVAKRINSGYNVPDQHGCGKGW